MSLFHPTPITKRRFAQFKANRRGYWSFWIFMFLFIVSLGAEAVSYTHLTLPTKA